MLSYQPPARSYVYENRIPEIDWRMDQRSCETLHELVKMQETARFPADGENDELREPGTCLSHIRYLLLRCRSRESYSRVIEGFT